MRKKGCIEWIKLEDVVPQDDPVRGLVPLAGVEVGLRHVGPVEARRMGRALQAFRLAELRRIVAAREGLTPDVAPHLFEIDTQATVIVVTPEGAEESDRVIRAILEPVVAGARGLDVGEEPGAVLDELDRLSLLPHLVRPALEVQAVSAAQFPPPPGAGVAQP